MRIVNICAIYSLSLSQLAKALVEYETLTGEEVRDVIAGKPIRGGKAALNDNL